MRFLTSSMMAACLFFSATAFAAPENFSQAKRLLREHVYADQNHSANGDFYCGCKWEWTGKSGGAMDQASCGFQANKMLDRASRLEWEHTVPISTVAQQRQCWRDGGRDNCQQTDPVFNRMEADMFNLVPSIGTVNAMRSNTNYGMAVGPTEPLGACMTKVGTAVRVVEPRDEVKGQAARITFYMADRYNLRLSEQQQRTFIAWDRSYPVTPWELERDKRIAYSMGHHNEFVTGQRQWVQGYRPLGEGAGVATQSQVSFGVPHKDQKSSAITGPIYGNKRSGVYHLPQGCPSYDKVSAANRVEFKTEPDAIAGGFRKAGNCS
ncbi:endonuclease [Pseudomonas syringae]|uniref:endonuclease n=1 Tax=Pseudomonas syringae TaxID=317 RepID=UPI001F237391|nr:endonuclease [Pseudomonas syringae]MCF5371259.1 deoxyribonuclease I [Pseudomonas syringae]